MWVLKIAILYSLQQLWYYPVNGDATIDCFGNDINIIGTGLFDQNYVQDMALAFATNRSVQLGFQMQFSFDAGNSTYGIQRLENIIPGQQPAAFASTETTLTAAENLIYPTITAFPLLIRSIVVAFNLPGISNLNLSLAVLAQVYLSKDILWNDTMIQDLNPGVELPGVPIFRIARGDNVADTRTFTSGLGKNNDYWNSHYGQINDPLFVGGYCCNSLAWPPGSVQFFAQGAFSIVGLLQSIPYTIAYMKMSDARLNQLNFASLQNPSGNFILPTTLSVQTATEYAAKQTNATTFSIVYSADPAAYPLVRFTYISLYNVTPAILTCCQMRGVVGLMYTLINDDSFRSRADKYFVTPLTPTVMQRANTVIGSIRCNNIYLLGAFLDSLVDNTDQGLQQGAVGGIVAAAAGVLIVAAMTTFVVLQQRAKKALEDAWIISGTRVQLKEHTTTGESRKDKSLGSLSKSTHSSLEGSSGTGDSSIRCLKHLQLQLAEIDEQCFLLQSLEGAAEPRRWSYHLRHLVGKYRRECVHNNLLDLIGVTAVEGKVFTISEYAAKGTLSYVLHTTKYDLNDTIRYNIAIDVAEGMAFLHKKGITHGLLSSISCFVDNSWTVKVANWVDVTIWKQEAVGLLHKAIAFVDNLDDQETLIRMLYLDMEICGGGGEVCQACDVSSYGLLLVEIWTGQIPYAHDVDNGRYSFGAILKDKFRRCSFTKPSLSMLPTRLQRTAEDCFRDLHKRYTFNELLEQLNSQRPSNKGIVDEIMLTMEGYSEQLEQKVDEHTQELSVVTKRMQELLHAVLPPQVAQKLFKGEAVQPELFESVSIFFSDIVGFTTISSKSTPLQVMTFLNDLWIAFDTTTEMFDVYKVDTIGDAYMVCSGCPQRNGQDHAKHIANLAIALMHRCMCFKIRQMPNEPLKIRVGLNSGQVIAGVVGTKMPQYCVFGETVITAMKMESSGVPMKIQISEFTQSILEERFSEFRTEFRGEVKLEGKGSVKTYWLLLDEPATKEHQAQPEKKTT